jgi:hypothetical protein
LQESCYPVALLLGASHTTRGNNSVAGYCDTKADRRALPAAVVTVIVAEAIASAIVRDRVVESMGT